jgi:hemolysin III
VYRGERLNSITHLIGSCLSGAGLVVLAVLAARQGNPWEMVSFSIYGAALVTIYFSPRPTIVSGARRGPFSRNSIMPLLICSSQAYTPFTLVTLRGAWGWSLFGVNWG